MRSGYIFRRVLIFLVIVWLAATVNFVIPRLSSANPIRERLATEMARTGRPPPDLEKYVKNYEAQFGLDQPVLLQYVRYMRGIATLDFGYSISNFPNRVTDMILKALPWTIALLAVATLVSFAIGTVLGAGIGWPGSPGYLYWMAAPILAMSAVPYYLLGLVLIYFLAYSIKVFPSGGAYEIGTLPEPSFSFLADAAHHFLLPALSIVLAAVGGWVLAMRGMMVTVLGEDFIKLAQAKGLKKRRIFLRYALRNAILPQVTSLALSLGFVVSGAIVVEVVFGYPGVGSLLVQAIRGFDYFVIQGLAFVVIVSIALATLILDVTYPLLDPRISYQRT